MSIKIGSKYVCTTCQSEFIVTKTSAEADMKCCEKSLEIK